VLLKITAEGEIKGKPHAKAVIIDTKHLTERIIKHSFVGEAAKPIKSLLLSAIRTENLANDPDYYKKAFEEELKRELDSIAEWQENGGSPCA